MRLQSPGQCGHAGGPGALRRVHVHTLGRTIVLSEIIRDARPGEYLHYQVIDAPALRSHRGQIFLQDHGEHCSLHWQVDFELASKTATRFAGKILQRQLGASLDKLQRILEAEPDDACLPTWAPVDAPSLGDWREAERVLAALRELASELTCSGDPKNVFAHVYSYVSEDIIAGCKANDFVYPAWALKLLPSFYDYYVRNLDLWRQGKPGAVESHWQRAFQVTDQGSSRYPGPDGQLLSGLFLSIHAHIASDLPRVLAEVYAENYAETCDYARFRGDYYAMGRIFQGTSATKKIAAHVPPGLLPRWAELLQRLMSDDMIQRLIYKHRYDVLKERRAAFRKGAEIADLLVRRHQSAPSPQRG